MTNKKLLRGLLVDEDADAQKLTKALFERGFERGVIVDVASSCRDAIDRLGCGNYDFVVRGGVLYETGLVVEDDQRIGGFCGGGSDLEVKEGFISLIRDLLREVELVDSR
jgi:hypothetical protein